MFKTILIWVVPIVIVILITILLWLYVPGLIKMCGPGEINVSNNMFPNCMKIIKTKK